MRWHHQPVFARLLGVVHPEAASAQLVVSGSPDIHLDLGGTPLGRGSVFADIEALGPVEIDLGPLPDGADVIAYAPAGPNQRCFVLGHAQVLAGGIGAGPRDVVCWDGNTHTLQLDGAAIGLPDGSVIDALSYDPAS